MRWLIAIGELALMCWFVAIGIEAIVQRATLMRSPFKMGEFHHAYLGVGLVILGFFIHGVTGILIQMLGVVLTADDVYQHQVQTLNGYTGYRSPLHQLFAATLWTVPGMPALVRFLDHWWRVGVVLGLLVVWLAGCARPQPLVPLVPRPDTRRITSFEMDSTLVRRSAEQFVAALPNEASLCLDGQLGPRPDRPGYLHVALTGIRPAAADSADQFHVYLVRAPKSGCAPGQLVALAHDHTTTGSLEQCEHSDPDAFVLFEDIRVLFSLVFCSEGRGEVLFQDGRRGTFVWSKPAEP
jgi:hypothetical protein